ncbi:MAG: hypothetical protein ACJ73D_01735 [Pyrinomonadaceae bacterium]
MCGIVGQLQALNRVLGKVLLISAIFSAIGKNTLAQTTPDLTGTWRADGWQSSEGGEVGSGEAIVFFLELAITQTPDVLTSRFHFYVDRRKGSQVIARLGDQTEKSIVHYDGRDDDNMTPGGQPIRSTTTWDKAKLVTTYYSEPDKHGKRRELGTTSLELDPRGRLILMRHSKQSLHDLDTAPAFNVRDMKIAKVIFTKF